MRDLISHFVGGGHMFAASLRGDPVDPTAAPADLLGDDYVGAYRASIDDFRSSLSSLTSPEQPAELPFGTLPADIALRIAAADLLVHGWDLATSTGQPFDPPADVVAEMEAFYRIAITPDLRASGAFGPAVEPRPDAPALERLVAFAGRAICGLVVCFASSSRPAPRRWRFPRRVAGPADLGTEASGNRSFSCLGRTRLQHRAGVLQLDDGVPVVAELEQHLLGVLAELGAGPRRRRRRSSRSRPAWPPPAAEPSAAARRRSSRRHGPAGRR